MATLYSGRLSQRQAGGWYSHGSLDWMTAFEYWQTFYQISLSMVFLMKISLGFRNIALLDRRQTIILRNACVVSG